MRYILIFLLVSLQAQAQRYDIAASYLQFVDSHHASVVEQTWNYMYTYTQESDYQKRNGQRKKLENVLNKSLRYIQKEKAFDPDLQKAAVDYLNGNIAIVKKDFSTLLKADIKSVPLVSKTDILRGIRNAMFKLRSNYDDAIQRYGVKHNLIINKNNSALAQQMERTIKVYDYYNKMKLLVQQIKDAEAYLWQDITRQTPDQFENKLQELQRSIDETKPQAMQLSIPFDIKGLELSYLEFATFFGGSYIEKRKPIIDYLKAASNNDRTDIVQKTTAFNKAKTWYNLNRKDAYTIWSIESQNYLKGIIKPIQ